MVLLNHIDVTDFGIDFYEKKNVNLEENFKEKGAGGGGGGGGLVWKMHITTEVEAFLKMREIQLKANARYFQDGSRI